MIRLGLIGYGFMGKTHAYAVDALKYYYSPLPFRAEIGGVYVTDPYRAERLASEQGFTRAYSSVSHMIADPDLHAISVCSPNCFHYEQILSCIEANKAIYCEKPLCITSEEAWKVARLANEKGICAQVVFQNRYLGAVMQAKKLIEQGKIGRLLSFRFAYLHASCTNPDKPAGWKQDKDICGGGVLFDLGSHVLDLCTHLCGSVREIGGVSQIGFPMRAGKNGAAWKTNADEAFYMTLRLNNGAVGTVEANKLATGSVDELNFEIYGEKGALRFSLMNPHYLAFFNGSAEQAEDGFVMIPCGGRYDPPGGAFPSPKAASGWLRGHVGSMYAFLSALYDKRAASPSFAQGAYVQTLMELALKSDQNGGRLLSVCLSEEEKRLCSFLD